MSKLTEQEINLAICKILEPEVYLSILYFQQNEYWRSVEIILPRYCEDMNLLMPLCWEHGIICYKHVGGFSGVCDLVYDRMIMCENKSPRIALAECLLKVLEAKE